MIVNQDIHPERQIYFLEQREAYKNGELSSEKIKLLQDINFVFDEDDALYRSFFYSDRGDNKNYTLERINKTLN